VPPLPSACTAALPRHFPRLLTCRHDVLVFLGGAACCLCEFSCNGNSFKHSGVGGLVSWALQCLSSRLSVVQTSPCSPFPFFCSNLIVEFCLNFGSHIRYVTSECYLCSGRQSSCLGTFRIQSVWQHEPCLHYYLYEHGGEPVLSQFRGCF
jgi:hypothetical protein